MRDADQRSQLDYCSAGRGRTPAEAIATMPIAFPKPLDPDQSSSSSESSYDEDEEAAMIQEEWEESLRQMEMVLSIVIFPFFGKWYGRRFSYWGESFLFLGTFD